MHSLKVDCFLRNILPLCSWGFAYNAVILDAKQWVDITRALYWWVALLLNWLDHKKFWKQTSNLCIICLPGFIVFIAVIWVLQEETKVRTLKYVILFIGMHLSLFFLYLVLFNTLIIWLYLPLIMYFPLHGRCYE